MPISIPLAPVGFIGGLFRGIIDEIFSSTSVKKNQKELPPVTSPASMENTNPIVDKKIKKFILFGKAR